MIHQPMDDQVEKLRALRQEQAELAARLARLDARITELESAAAKQIFHPDRSDKPPRLAEPIQPSAPPPPPPLPAIPPKAATTNPAPVSSAASSPETNPQANGSFEAHVGQVWLVRVGVLMLLTGLVFLGNFAYHEWIEQTGPIGRLAMLYFAAAALAGLGTWLGRTRAAMVRFGNVLIGGGLATAYYATYAAHRVDSLRVIESPILGGVVLIGFACGVFWLADRIRSRTLAGATLVLAFYTAAINPVGTFALFSNLLLAGIAVALVLRRDWLSLSFLALIGTYLAFAFWRFYHTGSLLSIQITDAATLTAAIVFPATYWLIFSASWMQQVRRSGDSLHAAMLLTLNNAGFFALTSPVVAGSAPEWLWRYTAVLGLALLALLLALTKWMPGNRRVEAQLLAQTILVFLLALFFRFSGPALTVSFALAALTLSTLSRLNHRRLLLGFGLLAGLLSLGFGVTSLTSTNWLTALNAGAAAFLLIACAWSTKAGVGMARESRLTLTPVAFASIGWVLAISAIAALRLGPPDYWICWGMGLLCILLARAIRFAELALIGIFCVLVGDAAWVVFAQPHSAIIPWLAAVLVPLAVGLWVRHQHVMTEPKPVLIVSEMGLTIMPPIATLIWLFARMDSEFLVPAFALAGSLFLITALILRLQGLAIGSLLLSGFAVSAFVFSLLDGGSWGTQLLTAVLIAVQSIGIRGWGDRLIPGQRHAIWISGQAFQIVSLILGLIVLLEHVQPEWAFLLLILSFAILFGIGVIRRQNEWIWYSLPILATGGLNWAATLFAGDAGLAQDFLGFCLVLGLLGLARRASHPHPVLADPVYPAMVVLTAIGGWIAGGRTMDASLPEFPLTVAWALFAFAILGSGFALRDRAFRLVGLLILGAATVRIFASDVWQLGTAGRILSFLVLGAVLVSLGFLYNRFAEVLRKFL